MTANKNEIVCWDCRYFSKSEKNSSCLKYSVELPQLGYEIFCSQYHNDSEVPWEPLRTFSQHPVRDGVLYFYSYAVGPAPFELASISSLRNARVLSAAVRFEPEATDVLPMKIEIKKNAPDLDEMSFVLGSFHCVGRRESPMASSSDRKVVYTFSASDQLLINQWLFKHYRRDKVYGSWQSKPTLKNYGVHAFAFLRYEDGVLKSTEILEDGLANAVIYGGVAPESKASTGSNSG